MRPYMSIFFFFACMFVLRSPIIFVLIASDVSVTKSLRSSQALMICVMIKVYMIVKHMLLIGELILMPRDTRKGAKRCCS